MRLGFCFLRQNLENQDFARPAIANEFCQNSLAQGLYELRASLQGIHYRILYFFHGRAFAILSHGIVKERAVPPREIERAIQFKNKFIANPAAHSYEEIGR